MAADFNFAAILGRLTRDPTLNYSKVNNVAIVTCSLACKRAVKDGATGEWKDETDFVDIKILGGRAEAFSKFFTKGQRVLVEGSLKYEHWTDKNTNAPRSKLLILVDKWHFVEAKKKAEEQEPEARELPPGVDDTPF